jgi:glutamyl-tRNA reductase
MTLVGAKKLLDINVPRNITIIVASAFELLQVDTLEMRAWRTST